MVQAPETSIGNVAGMDRLLARIIVAARVGSGMTQVDLAKRLERPQSFVSKIEAGDRRVTAVELVIISRALGRDARDMVAELLSAPPVAGRRIRRKPAGAPEAEAISSKVLTGGGGEVETPDADQ